MMGESCSLGAKTHHDYNFKKYSQEIFGCGYWTKSLFFFRPVRYFIGSPVNTGATCK
jgi:hypothetical protein